MWIHFYHIFFPIFPFFVKISLREIYLVELPSSPRNVIESQLVQLRTFLLSNFPFLSRFTGIRGEKIWPRATRRGSRKGGIARENQPKIRGDAQTRERERHGLCRKAAWQRGCCPRRHYGPKSLSTPGFPIPNPPTVSLLIAKCSLPYFASLPPFFPLPPSSNIG